MKPKSTPKQIAAARQAVARADKRAERAWEAYRNAKVVLDDARERFLLASGWERIWCWPPRERLWRRGQRTFTTHAAMVEQGRLEKRNRRARAKKLAARA